MGDGFEEQFFSHLFDLEAENFWFKARGALVRAMLRRYFPSLKNVLEIGCGTGYMLAQVQREFPQAKISGSEIFSRGLYFARLRVPKAELFQMDGRHIPFEDEFDVIGAYDVIEHIVEDEAVLSEMYRATRAGGGIVITVPQHKFLWSHVDEHAHHKRRYVRNELCRKVTAAGFTVTRVTSFVSLLLPLMYLSRWRKRSVQAAQDADAELRLSPFLNHAFGSVMGVERLIIDTGLSLPAGGSLLLVAKKPLTGTGASYG